MFTPFAFGLAAVLLGAGGPPPANGETVGADTPQVVLEVRIVSMPSAFFERRAAKFTVNVSGRDTSGRAPEAGKTEPGPVAFLDKGQTVQFLDNGQTVRFLRATQEDRRTNIMQTPKMTVRSGQTGSVDVTDMPYFVTGLEVVPDGDQAVVRPKNEAVRTGMELSARPTVSADRRFVELDVTGRIAWLEQEMSPAIPVTIHLPGKGKGGREQADSVTVTLQQPAVKALALDRSFRAADGQTAVLHWGTTLAEGRTETGPPPLLSRIPYVHRLFRTVSYGREPFEVILLIMPRILTEEKAPRASLGSPQASASGTHP